MTPERAAGDVRRRLAALAKPAGEFDAIRYFRGGSTLRFYNIGAPIVRGMARALAREHRGSWSLADALQFAERLMPDPHLEVKGVAIETLACYRREFVPRLLPVWKRWLAHNHASNWATTDALCGRLIGPLLLSAPALVAQMPAWARHRNMWVRRAAAVSLITSVRRGRALDIGYAVARQLHGDEEALIQKAVGWMLREAGKPDPAQLERYLLTNGPAIPRTTVRYAIERFPVSRRRRLLSATRGS